LFKWTLAAAAVIVAVFWTIIWFESYGTQKAWDDACAEADRLDPGWRWEDMMAARPNPPDERSAAVRVTSIRESMPAKWPDWTIILTDADLPPPPTPSPMSDDATAPDPDVRRSMFGTEEVEWATKERPEVRLGPLPAAALRKAIVVARDALRKTQGLEELAPGRFLPERGPPLFNKNFVSAVQDLRAVAVLLRLQSAQLVHDGHPDAALVNSHRILTVERCASAEPMFIHALVAMAIRAIVVSQIELVLAQGEPGTDALVKAQGALEATLGQPFFVEALRGERAFFEDCVRSVDNGLLTPEELSNDPPPPPTTGIDRIDRLVQRLRGGTWTKRQSAGILRYYTFLIEIAKESSDALRVHAADIADYRDAMDSRVFTNTQSVEKMILADRRTRAQLAAAAAALAAERFRREKGRWPNDLNELVETRMLFAVPIDPFNGKSLLLKRLTDGLVIYSVGQDLTDDGGEVRADPNVGGPPKDAGLRLWDVAHRRQSR
jgi:hypothetical protein